MNEHVHAALPADPRPAEVLAPLVNEPPPTSLMPSHTPEEIRALDRAFVGDKEKTDAIAGFIGLWLSSPWLAGLLADHFHMPPEEDEEDPKRKLDGPEPHGNCC